MIYWELFFSFAQVGLFCVGGGYASMPLIQAQVIDEHGWLTMNEFVDIFTISQMTPGPIGVNAATFVGNKVAGVLGAIAATLGFVAPSIVIVLALGYFYYKYGEVKAIKGILNGLRPAVVSLIASAGIGILLLALWNKENLPVQIEKIDWIGLIIFVLALFAIRTKTLSTIKVLAFSGCLGIVFYNFF